MPCSTILFESVCYPWPNCVVGFFFLDTNLALQTRAEVPCEGIMNLLSHFFYLVKFYLKLSRKGISRIKVKKRS